MKPAVKSAATARVLKALGIFGGVQVISILCSVVRTKLGAIWLGPAGVGIMAVYFSTMDMLSQTAQLNIPQSAVRDLSALRHEPSRASVLAAALRRFMLLLSGAGMVLVLLCSPLVSLAGFGDYSHTADFALLSLWIVFASTAAIEIAIMRADDRLGAVARTGICTSLTSIAAAVPLFYFFRLGGIVPALLAAYASNCLFAVLFRRRPEKTPRLTLRRIWVLSRGAVRLGIYMTVSSFVTLLASYVFIVYLNRAHSESAAGIYQAGYTLVNTYVGMIFTAIAMEYYPRLSRACASVRRMEVIVSHEIKIALWVLMPVAVAFICCSGLIVRLLYSSEFEAAAPFVAIGACGVFFRAVSWCIAFTILARGDGRTYIITETLSSVAYLCLYIPLFDTFGYEGLGIGYVLWYGAYTAVCYIVYRYRYGMRLRRGIAPLMWLSMATGAAALALYYLAGPWWTAVLFLPPLGIMAMRRIK